MGGRVWQGLRLLVLLPWGEPLGTVKEKVEASQDLIQYLNTSITVGKSCSTFPRGWSVELISLVFVAKAETFIFLPFFRSFWFWRGQQSGVDFCCKLKEKKNNFFQIGVSSTFLIYFSKIWFHIFVWETIVKTWGWKLPDRFGERLHWFYLMSKVQYFWGGGCQGIWFTNFMWLQCWPVQGLTVEFPPWQVNRPHQLFPWRC